MIRSRITGLTVLALSLFWASVAEAQRTSIIDQIRERRTSKANPGAVADDVGAITGDERFLRDARDADSFVGASREGGFVGGTSAVDQVEIRSAVEGDLVREAIDPAINRMRTLPQLPTGMYAPRLRLGFTPTTPPALAMETEMVERLSTSTAIHESAPLEVSLAGRTATLHGTVGSEHERRLAGLMLLFEPGISKVENQLAVAPSDAAPPELPPPSAPIESPALPTKQPAAPK